MSNTKKPTFTTVSIKQLVDKLDPGRRAYQPVVYYFSGGRTKKEPRVPGPYRNN